MQITFTLSDDEALALAAVAADPQAWAENVVRERCRRSQDTIVQSEVAYLLAHGQPLPQTASAILASAVAGGRAAPAAQTKAPPAAALGAAPAS